MPIRCDKYYEIDITRHELLYKSRLSANDIVVTIEQIGRLRGNGEDWAIDAVTAILEDIIEEMT